MTATDLATYLTTLRRVRATGTSDDAAHALVHSAARALAELPVVDRQSLAGFAAAHPEWVPVLGLVAGLSREQLRRALQQRLGSAGWVRLARERPADLIAALDDEFSLVARVTDERHRTYGFADILLARAGSRRTAGEAQAGGRGLEDAIEAVAAELGLSCRPRTRFLGRGGRSAPADLAVPEGGRHALIVCAAKGFDSTGSKLTDAVREIEEMAEVRLPTQYVFAVVDGIGWLGRQADLRRIHALAADRKIDGLYSLAMIDDLRRDLGAAANRLGLLGG